ncbi:MAG: restriction endonuclease [Bacteroidota bacterium]
MSHNPFKKDSKPYLFFELARPDENGQSRKVAVSEFINEYEKLKLGNGGSWCREDSSLGKKYIIERYKYKNTIVTVQLFGFNTKNQIHKDIKLSIKNKIKNMRCAVLDIGNVEVDHKDGHRDDYKNFKMENQESNQFQPLSKAVNNAKKEHCKKCRENKNRFDAKKLGYKESVWTGDIKYRGSCVGCYWHDIKKFNQEISQNFNTNF